MADNKHTGEFFRLSAKRRVTARAVPRTGRSLGPLLQVSTLLLRNPRVCTWIFGVDLRRGSSACPSISDPMAWANRRASWPSAWQIESRMATDELCSLVSERSVLIHRGYAGNHAMRRAVQPPLHLKTDAQNPSSGFQYKSTTYIAVLILHVN